MPPIPTVGEPARKVVVYKAARILLLKGGKPPFRAQLIQQLQTEHALGLLTSPIGRDLSLVTVAGVEFKVHSIMLIGGPKYLEEKLSLKDGPRQAFQSSITLQLECHPILADRLVTFFYTKDYDTPSRHKILQANEIERKLPNASFIPERDTDADELTALFEPLEHIFHLHMYALGEQLQYEALKTAARAKLLYILDFALQYPNAAALELLGHCVDACFSPLGSPTCVCKNTDGSLQQIIVAAILFRKNRSWTASHIDTFNMHFSTPQYATFCALFTAIEAENANLLTSICNTQKSKKQYRRELNHAKGQAKKKAAIDAHQPATTRSGLVFKPPPTPVLGPVSKNDTESRMSADAQLRRNKKTMLRQSRVERDDTPLISKAYVFGDADGVKAGSKLSSVLRRSEMQMLDHCFLRGRPQSDEHGAFGENEGVEEGSAEVGSSHGDQDLDAEMSNNMMRMLIDGETEH